MAEKAILAYSTTRQTRINTVLKVFMEMLGVANTYMQYLQEHVFLSGLLVFLLWTVISFLVGRYQKRVQNDDGTLQTRLISPGFTSLKRTFSIVFSTQFVFSSVPRRPR